MTNNQSPACFADIMGIEYTKSVNQKHKKEHGQFFTPVEIARLMSQLVSVDKESYNILDPGCGTGILSCALIEQLVITKKSIKSVYLCLYETDKALQPYLIRSIENLKIWMQEFSIEFTYSINTNDFILENAHHLRENKELFSETKEEFDIVISNPPYFKVSINDKRSIATKAIINGHPNIYAMFMAVSAKMLIRGGQIIFITPRSYASGSYFKMFRQFFFKIIKIEKVHLFVSRKDTFNRDNVLQETVIIKGIREDQTCDSNVEMRSSFGLHDINTPKIKTFAVNDIINFNSHEKILYLPTSDKEERILEVFKKWDGTLTKYHFKISTGPVVAFRAWDYISEVYINSTVTLAPLIWLHNVKKMNIQWPDPKPQKGQYIRVENNSKALLLPNKNYILIRRFSAKDDKNRLISAPYFSNQNSAAFVGIENKVNYITKLKGVFEDTEMIGISALLNSRLYDEYFRIFNGNVNVSATELRDIPFPPLEDVKEIGRRIIYSNDFSEENINHTVNKLIEYEEVFV